MGCTYFRSRVDTRYPTYLKVCDAWTPWFRGFSWTLNSVFYGFGFLEVNQISFYLQTGVLYFKLCSSLVIFPSLMSPSHASEEYKRFLQFYRVLFSPTSAQWYGWFHVGPVVTSDFESGQTDKLRLNLTNKVDVNNWEFSIENFYSKHRIKFGWIANSVSLRYFLNVLYCFYSFSFVLIPKLIEYQM